MTDKNNNKNGISNPVSDIRPILNNKKESTTQPDTEGKHTTEPTPESDIADNSVDEDTKTNDDVSTTRKEAETQDDTEENTEHVTDKPDILAELESEFDSI